MNAFTVLKEHRQGEIDIYWKFVDEQIIPLQEEEII